jgi:four helix bundle protein
MAGKRFEDLRVYQLAEQVADEIWALVLKWDRFARNTIGEQIVCAADSIGANIAEGTGRGTYQQNRQYVRISRGSFLETRHWLRRAYKRNLLKPEQVERIKPLMDNLGPQLNAYLKSIGKHAQQVNATPKRNNDPKSLAHG